MRRRDGLFVAGAMLLTAISASGAQELTVDAGADQVVTLAAGAFLDGQAAGGADLLTVLWTVVTGPGSVEFADPAAEDTQAMFAAPGRYVLRLGASDGTTAAGDTVTITVVEALAAPPTVSAGNDQTIGMGSEARLDGTVSPENRLTVAWSLVGGPGTVTVANPAALRTTARFAAPGTYVLRLTATDGGLAASDDVTITVTAANTKPRVAAGPSRTVSLPSAVSLTGTATDDGIPESPGSLTLHWSVVSGPGSVTFTSRTTATTMATFAVGGTYVLRLTAFDGALSAADDVTVVADPPPPGDKLLTAYGFDEGAGTAIGDRSGHDVALTRHGATWVAAARHGGGLAFDGVDDRVQGPPFTLPAHFTIMAWLLNPTAMPFETVAAVGTGRAIKIVSEELVFATADGEIPFGRLAADPSWHHVAVTYDGATLRAFVDGQPLGGPRPAAMAAFTGPLQFGAWPLGAQVDFFGGALDDLRIYGRALSAAEIARDLAAPIGAGARAPDTEAPRVQLEGPEPDAVLSDVVTITASATDDVGVTAVSFVVDDAVVGTEVTAPPYWVRWDTRTAANGPHTIAVEARDTGDNVSRSAPVTVRVVNPRPPAVNRPPMVSAGADLSVVVPGPALLDGTATDDGLPTSADDLTVTWQFVSGPAEPEFERPTEAKTLARFPVPGVYVLKLSAFDGVLSGSDEVIVTVTPAGQAPRR